MEDVYWLEQTEKDVPADNDWLSPREALYLERMRFAKRRADWRLGRWTAKRAVALCLNLPRNLQALPNIEICPALSGAPEMFVRNKPADVSISLSHRAGTAVCAVAPSGISLGCDLELVEPHSDAFLADYFTADEQTLVERAPAPTQSLLMALLWSAKESALKALHTGLRLDTRSVIVSLTNGLQIDNNEDAHSEDSEPSSLLWISVWHQLQVRCPGGQIFRGWWQHTDQVVRTMVAASPTASPILLAPVRFIDLPAEGLTSRFPASRCPSPS